MQNILIITEKLSGMDFKEECEVDNIKAEYTWDELYERAIDCACMSPELRAKDNPELCTCANNEPDGEPDTHVNGEITLLPRRVVW